ncbi:hypothetical protein FRC00_002001 [Tulasnella sp. 408]|nr:hypothetical protein FRC00_002001 [Tulasnella sp. 408]
MSQLQLKPSEACIHVGGPVPHNNPDFNEGGGSSELDSENGLQDSCRIKKLALDLLSALCGKRIDPTKLKFNETAVRDHGGYGDVVEATLVDDSDDEPQSERQVAVKKIRFSSKGGIEKLLKLNILVSDSYRAFITDFGSARFMREMNEAGPDSQPMPLATNHVDLQGHPSWRINSSLSDGQLTLTGPGCSLRWAAPEVLGGQHPGLASDVWAFGWVCWEVSRGIVWESYFTHQNAS